MTETPGKRLYKIRLACGDGARTPESMAKFVVRIKAKTKAVYHANAISLLERDSQGWLIEDAEIFARVDPLKRGRVWLAFGAEGISEAADWQARAPHDRGGYLLTEPSSSAKPGKTG